MASDPHIYTLEEVASHNKTEDCWLVISGKVYDVTPFMDDHPGGDDALLTATGKDATDDFENIGHSDTAREAMEKYYIGEIEAAATAAVPVKPTDIEPMQTTYSPDKTSEFVIKILKFVVPLLILGLAFAVRQHTQEK